MKYFYDEILDLDKIWDEKDVIAFDIAGHQLSVTYDVNYLLPTPQFSIQPGWQGGTEPRTSWSLEYETDDYWPIIEKISKKDYLSYYTDPKWLGYWSYPVLDPMNNPIELTCKQEKE